MQSLRISSFSWYGGKNRPILQNALSQTIPPGTNTFVECCAGSAALSLNKACHNQKMVLNDIDSSLINLFSVWKGTDTFVEFSKAVYAIRNEESVFSDAKRIDEAIDSFTVPNVAQAVATYTVITQSFNAARKQFRRGINQHTYTKRITKNLIAVHSRLQKIHLENKNLMEMIETYGKCKDNTLYLDVPYIGFTRAPSARSVYRAEMSYSDHAKMLKRLINEDIKALVIISGYMPDENTICSVEEDSHIYDNTLLSAGWNRYLLSVVANSSSKHKQQENEWIWVNRRLCPEQTIFFKDCLPYYMNNKGEICHG